MSCVSALLHVFIQQTSKKERENVNEEEKLRERAEEFGKYVIQRGPSVCVFVCVCMCVCACVCVFSLDMRWKRWDPGLNLKCKSKTKTCCVKTSPKTAES